MWWKPRASNWFSSHKTSVSKWLWHSFPPYISLAIKLAQTMMMSMYTTQQCLPRTHRTHHTSTTCKAGCSFSWHCILVVVCLRWQCQASVAFSVQHFCDHVLHGEYRVINGHGNGMIIYKARLLPGTNTTVRSRPTTALPLVANGRRWQRAIT